MVRQYQMEWKRDSCLKKAYWSFLYLAQKPPVGQGLLILNHTNDTPQSVGLFWTSEQLVAETSV